MPYGIANKVMYLGMSKQMRDKFYPLLVRRDGEFCQGCTRLLDEIGILEIHHRDGDDTHNKLNNMALLCHGCNHRIPKATQLSQREYTPEHKINIEKEPLYQKWLYGELMIHNWHIPLKDAIDDGAYNVGVSVETTKRYLRKLTSKSGPYAIATGQFGTRYVWLKGKEGSDELDLP